MSILRFVAREKPPAFRAENLDERLGRIERTLTEIAERIATKADLERLRKETNADLEHKRQTIATKAELDEVRRTMATKADLDEIRRTMATKADLDEIGRTMATKVELESIGDDIRKVADGYASVMQRVDQVAELLKTRLIVR